MTDHEIIKAVAKLDAAWETSKQSFAERRKYGHALRNLQDQCSHPSRTQAGPKSWYWRCDCCKALLGNPNGE